MVKPLRAAALTVSALLTIACIAFALRVPGALPLHAGMLAILLATTFPATSRPLILVVALVAVLMTLYSSLAEPAFAMMGASSDHMLAAADRALFLGHDPALVAEPFAKGATLEAASVVYSIFIPYLWLSILLGCFGRPSAERDAFVLGLAVTYSLAYLGYLFLPSRGPVEWYAFAAPLHGGRFHQLVLRSVTATGGNHGAFPSLHVGASAYLCMFDLRRNMLRGLTYLPIVGLIAISTVLLRYHYIVDIAAGLGIAALAQLVARRAERA